MAGGSGSQGAGSGVQGAGTGDDSGLSLCVLETVDCSVQCSRERCDGMG